MNEFDCHLEGLDLLLKHGANDSEIFYLPPEEEFPEENIRMQVFCEMAKMDPLILSLIEEKKYLQTKFFPSDNPSQDSTQNLKKGKNYLVAMLGSGFGVFKVLFFRNI